MGEKYNYKGGTRKMARNIKKYQTLIINSMLLQNNTLKKKKDIQNILRTI